MSSVLWWVPLTAGLQDGINPCALINAALVLLGALWLKKNGYGKLWFLFLAAVMFLSSFIFNCGFLDKFILNKYYETSARIVYVVLAMAMGLKGAEFLNQWVCLIKGKETKSTPLASLKLSRLALGFVIVFVGAFLSLLASLWPISYFITVFSIYMALPGQFFSMASLIALYTLVSLWVSYSAIWSVSMESSDQRLFKMVAAAILLSAAISAIDLFL